MSIAKSKKCSFQGKCFVYLADDEYHLYSLNKKSNTRLFKKKFIRISNPLLQSSCADILPVIALCPCKTNQASLTKKNKIKT
jgi:hypothetical protein